MLEVADIEGGYAETQVLRGVSLSVAPGEVVCLLGRNGAGKTTTLRAIMGLVRTTRGHIRLSGVELSRLPAHQVPRHGIGYVPQGRRLFSDLTVAENLEIGLMARGLGQETRERALHMFPVLRERLGQHAGTLSGGEQQMLAIARALCLEPSVLLLDEPTEGLMPSMIARIFETVRTLRKADVGVLLVEQHVESVLALADRVVFIENGRTRETRTPAELRSDPAPLLRYVGVGGGASPTPRAGGRGLG